MNFEAYVGSEISSDKEGFRDDARHPVSVAVRANHPWTEYASVNRLSKSQKNELRMDRNQFIGAGGMSIWVPPPRQSPECGTQPLGGLWSECESMIAQAELCKICVRKNGCCIRKASRAVHLLSKMRLIGKDHER